MPSRTLLILTVAVLSGGVAVRAHHSFAAYYLEDQSVTIHGELVTFEYKNPHAWLRVAALDNDGRLQTVGAEWANPGRLNQQGITKETLKPGERLIITGSPSRNTSEYAMHLKKIERPADGWTWVGRGERR
jgi:uncharacterized protein DUF6152